LVCIVTVPATTGTVAAASFTVSDHTNYAYAITLPLCTTITSGANNMTVSGFTSTPIPIGTLSGTGPQTLNMGVKLLWQPHSLWVLAQRRQVYVLQ
jgi:hypothetical protein